MAVPIGARRMEAAHTRLKGVVGLDYWPFAGRFALNGPYVSSPEALPGASFSRTGAGTLVHPTTGQVIPFASGQRRWAVGAGELVQRRRTNLFLRSNTFSNAAWVASVAKNLVANNVIGPDGTLSASTLSDNSAAAYQGMSQAVTVPNDTAARVVSIFVAKTTGGTSPTFGINGAFTGGTITSASVRLNTDTGAVFGSGTLAHGARDVGAFWWLWFVQANNGLGNTVHSIGIFPATSAHGGGSSDTVTATGSAVIWQADNQAGTYLASPIFTEDAAGTTEADSSLINAFPALPPVFTVFAEWTREGGTDASSFYRVASLERNAESSESSIYQRHTNNVVRAFQSTSAVTQADLLLGTGNIGVVQRAAARFGTNDITGSLNGAAAVSDTSVIMPPGPPLVLAIGSTASVANWLDGRIHRIRIVPWAVSDAGLQGWLQ